MTTDLHGILGKCGARSDREPNVTEAWKKAHRRNSLNRVLRVSGPLMAVIVVVVVALFSPFA